MMPRDVAGERARAKAHSALTDAVLAEWFRRVCRERAWSAMQRDDVMGELRRVVEVLLDAPDGRFAERRCQQLRRNSGEHGVFRRRQRSGPAIVATDFVILGAAITDVWQRRARSGDAKIFPLAVIIEELQASCGSAVAAHANDFAGDDR